MKWADDLLHEVDCETNEEIFFAKVQHAAEQLGFEYCAYGMRLPVPFTNPKTLMMSSYPSEWQRRYAQCNYLDVDPTVQLGKASQRAIIWGDDVFAKAPDLWNDARDAGLSVGWAKSSLDGMSIGGMLTLARSREKITEKELTSKEHQMRWLVKTAHQGFRRIQASKLRIFLSSREKEVLQWAADGKTVAETVEIMGIAESTVKFHTRRAEEKLGAVNRTSAVARALVMGLLM